MKKRLLSFALMLIICMSIFTMTALATNMDGTVYTDARGNEITIPGGAASCATRVVSFTPGENWTSDELAMDPAAVLNVPDYDSYADTNYVTLGAGGSIVLEFNIDIFDGEGNDIYIFEIGPDVEATKVEVSSDLQTWIYVGDADGSLSGVDLNGKIADGECFRYVRITDLDMTGGSYPGADIDAVAGLNYKVQSSSPEFIASDWAKSELAEAEELGIIPDCLDSKDLTKPINRAEFAAVSVKVYEALTSLSVRAGVNPFTDTYDTEVLKAYAIGITNGTSATAFSPYVTLNREQAATMLTRVLKKAANSSWTLDTDKNYSLVYSRGSLFFDNAQISDFAWDSVYFMAAKGIINGTGNNKFSPRATTDAETAVGYASATREQALLIALRMVKFSDGTEIGEIISYDPPEEATSGIDSYIPNGFDWNGGANGDDTFIDGKWVSPDGQSVLYIAHDEGPDSFTIWYYSCKDGYLENTVYKVQYADIIGEGKAECVYAGLTFTGVRDGLLVESEWLDEMYDQYGSPDGIYYLAQAR